MMKPANWLGIDNSHIIPLEQPNQGLQLFPKRAWCSMVKAANADGLQLTPISSYRDFHRQLTIWNMKFAGKRPVLNDNDEVIDISKLPDLEKIISIMRFSALPGCSRHHWGTDLDVYCRNLQGSQSLQLTPSEYLENGIQYPTSCWLQENMERFGFFLPYTEDLGGVSVEPWHISHFDTAQLIFEQLDTSAIYDQLKASDVAGQSTILKHLDYLLDRFVMLINEKSD